MQLLNISEPFLLVNHCRLGIRADEGRIDDLDLQLAGLTKDSLPFNEIEKKHYDSDDTDSMVSQPGSYHSDHSFDTLDLTKDFVQP